MRSIHLNTPVGKKLWQKYLLRQTGGADPLCLRRDLLTRNLFGRPVSARQAVEKILADVKRQGDVALLQYVRKLEGFSASRRQLQLTSAERRQAISSVPLKLRKALKEIASHIQAFHLAQKPRALGQIRRLGLQVAERILPLKRVGIYVPGGVAPLASTVLMNALPAKVAGVREIIMATPPNAQGQISPVLVYAAELAGVHEIYRLGGAYAIAALAWGTETVPRVEKIVGPANIFGTEAKRQVVGHVGIDSLAGPSEILVIADESANPQYVAWDLLAQVEHGAGAVALLLTPSSQLIKAVRQVGANIERLYPEYTLALQEIVLFQVPNLSTAAALADGYAPEHLSLQVKNPAKLLPRIRRVGAAFLGSYSAQVMGDYTAGPNHVLPTGGTATWASALSVRDFVRYTSVVQYTSAGLRREGPTAIAVAEAEGLAAHAESIRQRLA